MPITIVPHDLRWKQKVEDFNARMRDAGSPWGFYVDAEPVWIPKCRDGQAAHREYYLCIEDGDTVRGGYALKPQRWLVGGAEEWVTDWQGPFTEGVYDKRFAALGLRLMRDMLKKQPLLFSWGHGSDDAPMISMIRSMGWKLVSTPVALRVLNPPAFLRENRFLRTDSTKSLALDALAFTGLGTVGLHGLHGALRASSGRLFRAEYTEVDGFGPWADTLWEKAKGEYYALAVRDAEAMNTLLPPGERQPEWSPVRRLRVTRGERDVGWMVVTCTKLSNDHRFGDLVVGTLVDYFAHPDDAAYVVAAGVRCLRKLGADVLLANQTDPRWHDAMRKNGFILAPNRRLFAMAPKLAEKMAPGLEPARFFVTNLDGHGPQGL